MKLFGDIRCALIPCQGAPLLLLNPFEYPGRAGRDAHRFHEFRQSAVQFVLGLHLFGGDLNDFVIHCFDVLGVLCGLEPCEDTGHNLRYD